MNLQTFTFNTLAVRVFLVAGEPWWVARDVCQVLGLDTSQVHKVMDRLDGDEKGRNLIPTLGGEQEVWSVNESGLYSMILRSDKPAARAFKRWITHDVLPAIRRAGGYQAPGWDVPKTFAGALALAARQAQELEEKTGEIAILEPKAAFCDAVSRAEDTHSIIEAAKILNTGQNRLFERLRGWGFLFRDGAGHLPYQQHVDSGLFRVVEEHYEDASGRDRCYSKVLVTGKGMVALQRRIAQALPVAMVRPQHHPRGNA